MYYIFIAIAIAIYCCTGLSFAQPSSLQRKVTNSMLYYSNLTLIRHKYTIINVIDGMRIIDFRKNDIYMPNKVEAFTYYSDMVDTLYPAGREEISNNKSLQCILLNERQSKPFRTSSLRYVWFPVGCHVLGYTFKPIKSIIDDADTKVWIIKELTTGELFIWKRYATFAHYSAELAFLSIANHSNLAKAVCTMMDVKPVNNRNGKLSGLVLRIVRGISSYDFFHALNSTERYRQTVRLGSQVLDCLKYIHWLGFTHGDVKPTNVVIDYKGNAILIDFGFALPVNYYSKALGTPNTIAPELVDYIPEAKVFAENTDWYSFGQTIVQWLTAPIRDEKGRKFAATKFWKNDFELRDYPQEFINTVEVRQLLYYLLNPDPRIRVFNTMEQLNWLENLPLWNHVDFGFMQTLWSQSEDKPDI